MVRNIRKTIVAIAIAALMIVQVVGNSAATTSQSPAPAPDLSAEGRVLDTFVDDLVLYDKKGAELRKKPTITHVEYELHERTGNDLKRRLAEVQNALRRAVDKLKAAGQWNNLDEIVLAEISDPRFQAFVRREGFKRTLEELATGLSNKANEITSPFAEALRNKVRAQSPDSTFETGNPTLSLRAVRVSYTTAPTMFTSTVRCGLARVRVKITRGFDGIPSDRANDAFLCYCMDFDCPTS